LIEKARVEADPKRQKALWAQAQKKIIEDAAVLPLCITKFVFARKTYVNPGYEMRSTLTLVTPIKETTDIRK
jgi:peptide/nickel transport system substrate-binding protein